jgi:hypothetical protein
VEASIMHGKNGNCQEFYGLALVDKGKKLRLMWGKVEGFRRFNMRCGSSA